MPFLVLQFNQRIVKRFPLSPERRMRVGRGEDNDIPIDDSAVSSTHATIEPEGGHYYITDFNSRNGTFVNRELVISRRLSHGDTISIGNHHLIFAYARSEPRPAEPKEPPEGATMCIDTPDHRAQLARSVAEIAEREKRSEMQAILTDMCGDVQPIPIEKPVFTIGKSPESDLCAKGWFVGGTAARIIRRGDRFYLEPAEGKPPRINSRPVRNETALKEFDVIEIGAAAWQFHYRKAEEGQA